MNYDKELSNSHWDRVVAWDGVSGIGIREHRAHDFQAHGFGTGIQRNVSASVDVHYELNSRKIKERKRVNPNENRDRENERWERTIQSWASEGLL